MIDDLCFNHKPISKALNPDPLHLVKADRITRSIIEFRRSGRFVGRNCLGLFDRPSIFQISCDTRRPKSMAARRFW